MSITEYHSVALSADKKATSTIYGSDSSLSDWLWRATWSSHSLYRDKIIQWFLIY